MPLIEGIEAVPLIEAWIFRNLDKSVAMDNANGSFVQKMRTDRTQNGDKPKMNWSSVICDSCFVVGR